MDKKLAFKNNEDEVNDSVIDLRNTIPLIYHLEGREDNSEIDEHLILWRYQSNADNLNGLVYVSKKLAFVVP